MGKKKLTSFKQLVKKCEKDGKDIYEEFITLVEVKEYLPLSVKIINKSIIGEQYLAAQAQINSIQEVSMTDENVAEMVGNLNDISKQQEIDYCFSVLNLYCEGIKFDVEEDLEEKEKEYDLLMTSGVYSFIVTLCGEDKEEFEKMLNKYISSGMNTASTILLKQLIQTLVGSINMEALEKLKEEIASITQTDGFKALEEISEKLK